MVDTLITLRDTRCRKIYVTLTIAQILLFNELKNELIKSRQALTFNTTNNTDENYIQEVAYEKLLKYLNSINFVHKIQYHVFITVSKFYVAK